jgi:O-antigen/teichoic acid export membrane protein
MSNKLKNIYKDELIKGSLILVVAIGLYNFFNYIFQMSMALMLGPADYGILATLMSVIYILAIPSEAIQTIISRYTSKFNVQGEYGKTKDLLLKGIKKAIKISIGFFVIYLIASIFISNWLKINFYLFAIAGLIIFSSFLLPINRGILQGRKKFKEMGMNLVTEAVIKIIFAIILVSVGFKVYGAMAGVVIGALTAFGLSFFLIKEVLKSKRKKEGFDNVYAYNFPSLITITAIVLMYSIDIILAKRFFLPELAGQYAFVSLIAKVILLTNLAVGKAMLPLASEHFERGKETRGLLKKSFTMVLLISIPLLLIYFLFPELVVRIISLGSLKYLAASNVLFLLGLAFTFTSFSSIILLYKISTNKMKSSSWILLLFVFIEVLLLSIFNSNIIEFSLSLVAANFLMFVYSLITLRIK